MKMFHPQDNLMCVLLSLKENTEVPIIVIDW